MVKYLPNNWKQKLDPSFDKLIKIYKDGVEVLDRISTILEQSKGKGAQLTL